MKSESAMKNKPDFVMNDPNVFGGRDFVNVRKVCGESFARYPFEQSVEIDKAVVMMARRVTGIYQPIANDALFQLCSKKDVSRRDIIDDTEIAPLPVSDLSGWVLCVVLRFKNIPVYLFSIGNSGVLVTTSKEKLDYIVDQANANMGCASE